jgi:SAM-dependent methyltransferase
MLRDLGFRNFQGLDLADEAIRFCQEKGLGKVEKGDVCAIPFPDSSFDLVLATDIIEHVDDDQRAVAEMKRVLAPGGSLLISVPTFPALWGLQDELAHHKRRYYLAPLVRLIAASGLKVRRHFYFNFLLFVPIWLARRALLLVRPKIGSEAEINTKVLNVCLARIFAADVAMAARVRLPFGVSALVLASKP